ncbi:drug/metabolite transporter (DMT)-like permease [Clostridiales Family XIII bacterium PM5-7]
MTKERKTIVISNIFLIIAAAIWGSNYVFQKIVATEIGPFTFMAARSLLGALTILPIVLFQEKKEPKRAQINDPYSLKDPRYVKRLTKIAIFCGCINVTGSVLVQWGLIYTDASRASFLNAIYIIFVPILGLMFFHKKTSLNTWVGVILSVIGLYLLCVTGGFYIAMGDVLVLVSTLFFALHIQLVSKFVHELKGMHLACLEFFFASIYCTIMAFFIESPSWQQLLDCSYSILFAGILGIGVCYALQFTAQKYTDPTIAALLMSSESVFGCLGGVLVLGETFTARELVGVVVIVAAIVFAQLPSKAMRKTGA